MRIVQGGRSLVESAPLKSLVRALDHAYHPSVAMALLLSSELQRRGFRAPGGWERIEHQLADMHAKGAAAWPQVSLEPVVFASYLAERATHDVPLEEALASLHASDLYLACACAAGDSGGVAAFDAAMADVGENTLRRLPGAGFLGDDARQMLCARLFLSEDGRPPSIAEYSGRAPLRSWFRVALTRQALSALRKIKREVPLDEEALGLKPSEDDPELSHLRRRYSAEFAEAFAAAMKELRSSERSLLRHHYIDRLSIDEMGAIYGIHRVTAARRLTRAREALVAGTRRLLAARLQASPSEVRSALRILDGSVDVTLRRMLRETGAHEPSAPANGQQSK